MMYEEEGGHLDNVVVKHRDNLVNSTHDKSTL